MYLIYYYGAYSSCYVKSYKISNMRKRWVACLHTRITDIPQVVFIYSNYYQPTTISLHVNTARCSVYRIRTHIKLQYQYLYIITITLAVTKPLILRYYTMIMMERTCAVFISLSKQCALRWHNIKAVHSVSRHRTTTVSRESSACTIIISVGFIPTNITLIKRASPSRRKRFNAD